MNHSVTKLLNSWQDNDKAAFNELVQTCIDEFRKRIRAVKARRSSTRDENSILNQIYLKLEKSPPQNKKFENRAEFWDYLLKTVNSVLLDDVRRNQKFVESEKSDGRAGDDDRPDAWDVVVSSRQHIGLEARDALEKLFEKLGGTANGERRAAILLLKAEGYTNEEIAADTEFKSKFGELSEETVKRDARLAKAFLHSELCSLK